MRWYEIMSQKVNLCLSQHSQLGLSWYLHQHSYVITSIIIFIRDTRMEGFIYNFPIIHGSGKLVFELKFKQKGQWPVLNWSRNDSEVKMEDTHLKKFVVQFIVPWENPRLKCYKMLIAELQRVSSKIWGEGRWYWIHDFVSTFGVNNRPICMTLFS